MILSKVPPHSPDAELSVLGSCLIDQDAVLQVADVVTPEMFYRDAHRVIYERILGMHQAGEPIDLVTLTEALRRDSKLQDVGGITYLAEISNQVPSAANAGHYGAIVREKWIRRGLIKAASRLTELAFAQHEEISVQCGEAEQAVFAVTQAQATGRLRLLAEAAADHWDALYQSRKQPDVTGLRTDYIDLDDTIGGLQPADLIVLAARPSQGKTALALNIAERVARRGKTVAFFSLEMSTRALSERLICGMAAVDSNAVRARRLSDHQWASAYGCVSQIGTWPFYVDDQGGLTSLEMRSRARRLKAEKGLDLAVIDYLQLIGDPRSPGMSRTEQLGQIMARLKAMARELDVPLIVLSQLNREVEHEKRAPRLSDLRESGDIEQTADLVWFIHQDENDPDPITTRKLIIAKHRNGPTGEIRLTWRKTFARFESYIPPASQQPGPPPKKPHHTSRP